MRLIIAVLSVFISTAFSQNSSYPCESCWCSSTYNEADVIMTSDLVYGEAFNTLTGKNETLLLDLYEPPKVSVAPRPVMVFVHGGGFHSGTKAGDHGQARNFSAHGFVSVSINYRLEVKQDGNSTKVWEANKAAMFDTRAAVRWLVANQTKLNIDTSRISVFGSSAGGMTAATLAYCDGLGPGESGNPGYPSNITAAVSLSGILMGQGYSVFSKQTSHPYLDIHGINDATVNYTAALNFHKFLDTQRVPNGFIEVYGGHVPWDRLFKYHYSDVLGFMELYMDLKAVPCPPPA